ncbi:MAG: hypothetical protein ACP5NX_02975 [Candidatus Bilamarchaeaceae archaeon]
MTGKDAFRPRTATEQGLGDTRIRKPTKHGFGYAPQEEAPMTMNLDPSTVVRVSDNLRKLIIGLGRSRTEEVGTDIDDVRGVRIHPQQKKGQSGGIHIWCQKDRNTRALLTREDAEEFAKALHDAISEQRRGAGAPLGGLPENISIRTDAIIEPLNKDHHWTDGRNWIVTITGFPISITERTWND